MNQQEPTPEQYVGLDVSLETTAVCIIDANGAIIWRGKCAYP
jgi:hypothetical protein